jgi:16S rRNA (guanine1207-N2)-methyltransferase
VLVPEAGYGVVPMVLADASGIDVRATESSARAAALCRRNARENGVADVTVALAADLAGLDGAYDAVAYAPRPYTPLSVGRQRLADACSLLRPGGRCYLAARERAGRARYASTLETIAGDVETVAERGDCTLLAATVDGVDPPTYVTPRTLTPTVGDVTLSLRSVPGLFAAAGLDDGTRLLCEAVDPAPGERVLDLCSGYGAIGAYVARAGSDLDVVLTDDDRAATVCAECGLDATGVEARVVTADCLEGVSGPFDRILCNPPTHAGSGVLAELFAGARAALAPGGSLAFVRHRALDLSEHLDGFSRVRTRREGAEHVVRTAVP